MCDLGHRLVHYGTYSIKITLLIDFWVNIMYEGITTEEL